MPNIPALERTLTHITDHPDQLQQGMWTCNTGACFAGWGALLNGYEAVKFAREVVNGEVRKVGASSLDGTEDVRTVAMNIYDIGSNDADLLFCGSNTRDNLALMVKDLANGENLDKRWCFKRRYGGQLRDVGESFADVTGNGAIPVPEVVVVRDD